MAEAQSNLTIRARGKVVTVAIRCPDQRAADELFHELVDDAAAGIVTLEREEPADAR